MQKALSEFDLVVYRLLKRYRTPSEGMLAMASDYGTRG